MTSVAKKIHNRIRGKGRGWAFTPKDFVDLGTRNNVGTVLHRLVAQGFIRLVSRGIYDYPRKHSTMGDFPPNAQQVAVAVARATGDRVYPTGASAANRMGLTTQVPARTAYVTTGNPKNISIDGSKLVIRLQRATLPRTLTHDLAYMALQALDNIGPNYVDQKMIDKCTKHLTADDKRDIQKNLRYIRNPWLMDIARQLIV